MKISVTGVAGYIGSITAQMLVEEGHEVIGIDNLSTGHREKINKNIKFFELGLDEQAKLTTIIKDSDAVIHFAAKISVSESMEFPNLYYSNNIDGSRSLLQAIKNSRPDKLIFSSSAAVYGVVNKVLIEETEPCCPINPYGETKFETEKAISTLCQQSNLGAVSLRYFNVAGALNIGESWLMEKHEPETHLIPNILNSRVGNPLKIFGMDFDTPDGTCIRDYVHVVDIAKAHVLALKTVIAGKNQIVNIGSGRGYSVLEVFKTAEDIIGRAIPVEISERREGDPDRLVADISKATRLLNWQPKFTLHDMIRDAHQAIADKTSK